MTPCREHRESIAAGVLGALDPPEVRRLRVHLGGCEACARFHEEMAALVPLLDLAGGVDRGGLSEREAAQAVDLAGTGSAPSAWGTADLKAGPHGTTIYLEAHGLPESKPGQHYAVWLSDGRRGITAGTFRVGRDGKARCTLATAGRADHFRLVDVTLEEDTPPVAAEKHPVVLFGDI